MSQGHSSEDLDFALKGQGEGRVAFPQPRAAGKGEKMLLGHHPKKPGFHSTRQLHRLSPQGIERSLLFTIPHTSVLSHAFIHLISRHSQNIFESPLCAQGFDGF